MLCFTERRQHMRVWCSLNEYYYITFSCAFFPLYSSRAPVVFPESNYNSIFSFPPAAVLHISTGEKKKTIRRNIWIITILRQSMVLRCVKVVNVKHKTHIADSTGRFNTSQIRRIDKHKPALIHLAANVMQICYSLFIQNIISKHCP